MTCPRCYRRRILSNLAIVYSLIVLATGVVAVTLAAAKVLGFLA